MSPYFDRLREELDYLPKIAADGQVGSAIALAMLLVDRLSQKLYWPAASGARAFVDCLLEYGGEPRLHICHRRAFYEGLLRRDKKQIFAFAEKYATFFAGMDQYSYSRDEFDALLRSHVSTSEYSLVSPDIWRATMAYGAYFALRNAAVHGMGASGGLSFPPRLDGSKVESMGLAEFMACCRRVVSEAERRTIATGQWFGNDSSTWLDPRFPRPGV